VFQPENAEFTRLWQAARMWMRGRQQINPPLGSKANALGLEANAAGAGLALGCRYSSSDEYEAEIVQVRRAAGAYGTWRPWRQALIAFAAAVAVAIVLLVV
jgi:hypothetical protein